jgi:hypothetical protein
VALHAPPEVVEAWCRFQDIGNTVTPEGRARLVTAIQSARTQLGHGTITDANVHVLLFGSQNEAR